MSPLQLILTPLIVHSEGARTDFFQECIGRSTEMNLVRVELFS